jgi:hypothetical protein
LVGDAVLDISIEPGECLNSFVASGFGIFKGLKFFEILLEN